MVAGESPGSVSVALGMDMDIAWQSFVGSDSSSRSWDRSHVISILILPSHNRFSQGEAARSLGSSVASYASAPQR